MNSIRKGQKPYKIGFSFGMEDNSFAIEFCDAEEKHWFENEIPLWLIDRYRKFNQNQKDGIFYKYCSNCPGYYYSSNIIVLNHKTGFIDDLIVESEWVRVEKPTKNDDVTKVYIIKNCYNKQLTFVILKKVPKDKKDIYDNLTEPLKIPLLSLIPLDDLLDKLDVLAPFF